MALSLDNLSKQKSRKKPKRVGRGNASGKGNYSTRGIKGQRSRSGGKKGLKVRGLKPLIAQLPKVRGAGNFILRKNKRAIEIVNLDVLDKKYKQGEKINPEVLFRDKLIKNENSLVKVLARGKLSKGLEISAHFFSKKAKEEIAKSGGKAIILSK